MIYKQNGTYRIYVNKVSWYAIMPDGGNAVLQTKNKEFSFTISGNIDSREVKQGTFVYYVNNKKALVCNPVHIEKVS